MVGAAAIDAGLIGLALAAVLQAERGGDGLAASPPAFVAPRMPGGAPARQAGIWSACAEFARPE